MEIDEYSISTNFFIKFTLDIVLFKIDLFQTSFCLPIGKLRILLRKGNQ